MEIQCQEYEETPEFSTVLCRIIVGLEGYTDKIICLLKSKFFISFIYESRNLTLFFCLWRPNIQYLLLKSNLCLQDLEICDNGSY